MSENTKIEWCDSTFNPWIGCTKVSPACDHCYAERSTPARTLGVTWGPHAERRRTGAANWELPKRWNAQAEVFQQQHGRRQRVFCASLADVFDNQVPVAWLVDLLGLIAATPRLDWLLLTKRIGNFDTRLGAALDSVCTQAEPSALGVWLMRWLNREKAPRNIWLGATIVNQEEADRDIPKLLAVPARVRFLSVEPMLGPVDLGSFMPIECVMPVGNPWRRRTKFGEPDTLIDWLICGGESGLNARPMHPDWARSLRDQCAAAGVPFLFKQWGEFLPASADDADPTLADVPESRVFWSDGSKWDRFDGQRAGVDLVARVGKKASGRLLDGVEHNGFPS